MKLYKITSAQPVPPGPVAVTIAPETGLPFAGTLEEVYVLDEIYRLRAHLCNLVAEFEHLGGIRVAAAQDCLNETRHVNNYR